MGPAQIINMSETDKYSQSHMAVRQFHVEKGLYIPNGWKAAKKKDPHGAVMEEGQKTSPTKWTSPPHTCPLFKSDWVRAAAPRSHFSSLLLRWPFNCHSSYVHLCELHVIISLFWSTSAWGEMWRGQCTSHTLLRSIKCPAWSLPVFSGSLLSPQGLAL